LCDRIVLNNDTCVLVGTESFSCHGPWCSFVFLDSSKLKVASYILVEVIKIVLDQHDPGNVLIGHTGPACDD
jgi:hypothetical protein